MAAETSASNQSGSDLTECKLCHNDLTDPRSLTCLHTFCWECLQQQAPAEENSLKCPFCAAETPLPLSTSLDGLQFNSFIEGLVKLKHAAEHEELCEVCTNFEDSKLKPVRADKYCLDCRQHLCERCSRPHRLWRRGTEHQVVDLGEAVNVELLRTTSGC